jgi:PUA domain protein
VLQLKLKGEAFVSFYQIDNEIRFIDIRDFPILPMLRVLHRYPNLMSEPMQCDKGAIKHIFSGSHIMAPGLTSAGGHLVSDLPEKSPVAVMAEGKKHAMAVGVLSMSSK